MISGELFVTHGPVVSTGKIGRRPRNLIDVKTLCCEDNTHAFFLSLRFILHRALSTFRKETEDGQELELHDFEASALMNLVATDTMVEEAVALIPSLSKFPEAAIDEILDLIRSTMMRIVS